MDGVPVDQVPIIGVEALLELVAAVGRIAGRSRGADGDEGSWVRTGTATSPAG